MTVHGYDVTNLIDACKAVIRQGRRSENWLVLVRVWALTILMIAGANCWLDGKFQDVHDKINAVGKEASQERQAIRAEIAELRTQVVKNSADIQGLDKRVYGVRSQVSRLQARMDHHVGTEGPDDDADSKRHASTAVRSGAP